MTNGFTFNQKKSEDYGLRLISGIQLIHAKKKREVQMLPGSNRPVIIDYKIIENGQLTFPCTLNTKEGTTVFEQSSKISNWLEEPKDFEPLEFVGDQYYRYFAFHQGDNNLVQRLSTLGKVSINFMLNPYKILKKSEIFKEKDFKKNKEVILYNSRVKNKALEGHLSFPVIEVNQHEQDDYEVYLNGKLLVSISGYISSFKLDTLTMSILDQWGRPFNGNYKLSFFEGLPSNTDITLEIRSKTNDNIKEISVSLNWGTLV